MSRDAESAERAEETELKPRPKGVDLGFIPIPRRLRYDPDRPFHFGFLLNALFGLGSTFTVANLYYCQPILIQMSLSFDVTYSQVSRIPTLLQAGYAVGLLLLTPLGDLVRRRQLILLLVILSSAFTIGLAITSSVVVFEVLSFLVGVVTVTPQVLLPLAADLAPPHKRAAAISLVLAGLMLGVLIARVISGVVAQFATWRVIYYMAIGVQYALLVGLYLFIPDYPAKNDGITYWGVLWSMAKYAVTEPVLIQGALIMLATSAVFSNFWVTLTFLLGGPLYDYSTLDIGLFGLIGMFGVMTVPFLGRGIDKLIPWWATLLATFMTGVFQAIQTGAGGVNVGAVVVTTFGLDVFRQMQQVSITTKVFSVEEKARSRLNAILILSIFIGQVMGTAVGTKLFVEHGWRAAAAFSLGCIGFQMFILLLRGPNEARYTWFGYRGGLEWRRSRKQPKDGQVGDQRGSTSKETEKGEHTREGDVPGEVPTERGAEPLEEHEKSIDGPGSDTI